MADVDDTLDVSTGSTNCWADPVKDVAILDYSP